MKTRLDYNNGENVVPEGHIRIQASSFLSFFTSTAVWFREKLYGAEGFTGSTSSVLGTCVHFYSSDFFDDTGTPKGTIDVEEIERYISTFDASPEIDTAYIREQYPIMGRTLLQWVESHDIKEVERFLATELQPGIWIGGSVDCLEELYDGSYEIVDYKTVSALTAPKTISGVYLTQLKVYAKLYSQLGYNVTSLKIVYITHNQINRVGKTGNMLPDKPSVASEVRVEWTPEFDEQITGMAGIAGKILREFHDNPELRPLLAQDFRLNPNDPLPELISKEVDPDDV